VGTINEVLTGGVTIMEGLVESAARLFSLTKEMIQSMEIINVIIQGGRGSKRFHLRDKNAGTSTTTRAVIIFALRLGVRTTRPRAARLATATARRAIEGRRKRVKERTSRNMTKNMVTVEDAKVIEGIRIRGNPTRNGVSVDDAKNSKISRLESNIISGVFKGRNHMNGMSSKGVHMGVVMHDVKIKKADGGAGRRSGRHGRAGSSVTGWCLAIINEKIVRKRAIIGRDEIRWP
jgi:hypothetical protein